MHQRHYAYKFGRMYLRNLPVDWDVQKIAHSVCDALFHEGLIQGEEGETPALHTEEVERGVFSISLAHGSYYDRSLFVQSLNEVLAPVSAAG